MCEALHWVFDSLRGIMNMTFIDFFLIAHLHAQKLAARLTVFWYRSLFFDPLPTARRADLRFLALTSKKKMVFKVIAGFDAGEKLYYGCYQLGGVKEGEESIF